MRDDVTIRSSRSSPSMLASRCLSERIVERDARGRVEDYHDLGARGSFGLDQVPYEEIEEKYNCVAPNGKDVMGVPVEQEDV